MSFQISSRVAAFSLARRDWDAEERFRVSSSLDEEESSDSSDDEAFRRWPVEEDLVILEEEGRGARGDGIGAREIELVARWDKPT